MTYGKVLWLKPGQNLAAEHCDAVYKSQLIGQGRDSFFFFPAFSTMIKILTRTTALNDQPCDDYLENSSIGLTWWPRTFLMITESSPTELKTDQYYKALYFWLLNYLTVFQIFHSDISSVEISISVALI